MTLLKPTLVIVIIYNSSGESTIFVSVQHVIFIYIDPLPANDCWLGIAYAL